MATESKPRDRLAETFFQKWARALAISCGVLGAIAGFLQLFAVLKPDLFFQNGDEHMAWAIEIFVVGGSAGVFGIMAALFSRKKMLLVSVNCFFGFSWLLAEWIRVSL